MKIKKIPIDHPPIHKLEYNYITDGIFIGTNQCCQTHFDEGLKTKQDITAVISLEEYRVDAPFGVDFYLWMPVKNHTPPKMEQLDFGVSVLEKLVAMDKKIYVHCQNGHGRAPTLVAAYLIRRGQNPAAAELFIKNQRPSIHLDDTQRLALDNFNKHSA